MILDSVPIWAFFAGTIFVILISIEAGYRLGRFAHRRSDDEKESPGSAIAGTVLGLTAFMLAFVFGIVTDRFDARKELVRDDANAVRTAWLRSDFLPEPDRAEAKGLIREYLDVRLEFAESKNVEKEHAKGVLSETARIQGRLWDMAVANARKDMNSDVAALYIDSLNQVIAIHSTRVAVGLQARIPPGIWIALYGLLIIGMMGAGYHTGIAGSRRSMARPILAVSFSLVIMLIAALDRPGVIAAPQQPLIDLQSSIAASAQTAAPSPQPHVP